MTDPLTGVPGSGQVGRRFLRPPMRAGGDGRGAHPGRAGCMAGIARPRRGLASLSPPALSLSPPSRCPLLLLPPLPRPRPHALGALAHPPGRPPHAVAAPRCDRRGRAVLRRPVIAATARRRAPPVGLPGPCAAAARLGRLVVRPAGGRTAPATRPGGRRRPPAATPAAGGGAPLCSPSRHVRPRRRAPAGNARPARPPARGQAAAAVRPLCPAPAGGAADRSPGRSRHAAARVGRAHPAQRRGPSVPAGRAQAGDGRHRDGDDAGRPAGPGHHPEAVLAGGAAPGLPQVRGRLLRGALLRHHHRPGRPDSQVEVLPCDVRLSGRVHGGIALPAGDVT